jgi:hypothetical protein
LRNLLLAEKADKEAWTKECQALAQRVETLTKENDCAKTDITAMQATIVDLKEQVRFISDLCGFLVWNLLIGIFLKSSDRGVFSGYPVTYFQGSCDQRRQANDNSLIVIPSPGLHSTKEISSLNRHFFA